MSSSIFRGKEVLARHISLFSICGIAGLLNVLVLQNKLSLFSYAVTLLGLIIFELFFTGYEILFMQERELPDFDMRSFKIALKKLPFTIFAVNVIFLILSFIPEKQNLVLIIGIIFSVPLSMILGGFSYNFDNRQAFVFLKKFNIKDYIILFAKRIFIIAMCYLITFGIVFLICVIFAILAALIYKGDINSLVLAISSHQMQIGKLAGFIIGVLLTYTLCCGSLIWDYGMITMKED